MDPALLTKRFSSVGGQREALEGLGDRELRDVLTAPAALAFGAVPVAQTPRPGGGGGALVLGAAGRVHPDCRTALAAALGREVELVPFNEGLVREAIDRHYLRARGDGAVVDLPTFESPEFLKDPASARLLLGEKDGALPEGELRPPRGRVAFIELRMHSVLRSLDREAAVDFAEGPAELSFRLEQRGRGPEPAAVLFRDELPSTACRAVLSLSVFYDGHEHRRAVTGIDVEKLPQVLHPSEMQLAGISGDEARFFVYDRTEPVKAAWPKGRMLASFGRRYYFLHYGRRLERTLRLDVLSFVLVRRSRMRLAGRSDRLRPEDLERLLGLDFPGPDGCSLAPPTGG